MSSYSEQAAQWMARLKFSALPADVVASTKLRALDAKNIDAIITKVERLEQEATIAALIDLCVRQR